MHKEQSLLSAQGEKDPPSSTTLPRMPLWNRRKKVIRVYLLQRPPDSSFEPSLGSSLRTSTRLAVPVRLVDLVRVILSSPVVVLVGSYALRVHGTSQDSRSVFGQIFFRLVSVVVGVDKDTTFNLVACGKTVGDRGGEGVGHV